MKQASLAYDAIRDAMQRLPAGALTAAREAALAKLEARGLPSVRHEDWKYTDLEAAISISNRWLADGATSNVDDTLGEAVDDITRSVDANWLVIANGNVDASALDDVTGVDIEYLNHSEAAALPDEPLVHLNTALLQDGLRITIHAATEKPVGILVIDASATSVGVSQARVEIEVAPGCDAEIIEYQTSSGSGEHYGNSVISLHVGQAALANYARIQNRKIGHVHTGRLSVTLGADARLAMCGFDLGGGLVRNDVDVQISEPGADAVFTGLYLAGDGQHIDNHTRVDHRVGPATSSQEYRGILNGRCRCVWNGKAIVHKGADGTDANQANHNLLLSEKAEIDAKPELEIYADDVKCSHGTTVGQLDKTALFYLRTRGLDEHQARQVLTRAFAADLVARVSVDAARDRISALVDERLDSLLQETPA